VRPYVLARKTEAAYKRKRWGNPKAATRNLMTFNMQRQTIILTFAPARNYLKILNRVAALLPGARNGFPLLRLSSLSPPFPTPFHAVIARNFKSLPKEFLATIKHLFR